MNRLVTERLSIGMLIAVLTVVSTALLSARSESRKDKCQILFEVEHETSDCSLPQIDTKLPAPPRITATCGELQSVSYKDQYWELGCSGANGLRGYFAPEQWIIHTDDDGVDVTGAPNDILVEGANSAAVNVAAGRTVSLGFTVPAEGFIRFDWSKFGGSNFIFSIAINHHTRPCTEGQSGYYFSDPLRPGDDFRLRITAEPGTKARLELQSFSFLTSATGLTVRHWEAVDEHGNRAGAKQFITRIRPSLTDVIFPENCDGNERSALYSGDPISPAATGVPVFDFDGTPLTTTDQRPVDAVNCHYAMTYTDHCEREDDHCVIRRRWRIEDLCQGTTIEETQVIKHFGRPCVRENIPSGYDYPAGRPPASERVLSNINSDSGKENVNAFSFSEKAGCGLVRKGAFIVE